MISVRGSLIPYDLAADESVFSVFEINDTVNSGTGLFIEVICVSVMIDPSGRHKTCLAVEKVLLALDYRKSESNNARRGIGIVFTVLMIELTLCHVAVDLVEIIFVAVDLIPPVNLLACRLVEIACSGIRIKPAGLHDACIRRIISCLAVHSLESDQHDAFAVKQIRMAVDHSLACGHISCLRIEVSSRIIDLDKACIGLAALIVIARALLGLYPASFNAKDLIACKTARTDQQRDDYYKSHKLLIFHFYHLLSIPEKSPDKCITGHTTLVEQLCYRIGTRSLAPGLLKKALQKQISLVFLLFRKVRLTALRVAVIKHKA